MTGGQARGTHAPSAHRCLQVIGALVLVAGCRWRFDSAPGNGPGNDADGDGNIVLDDAGNVVTCSVDTDCGRCQRCANQVCERATFVQLGLGGNNGCALDELGEIWCWGTNSYLIVNNQLAGTDIVPRPRRRMLPLVADRLAVGWGVLYFTTSPTHELRSLGTADGNVIDTSMNWGPVWANHFNACSLAPNNALYCSGVDEFGQLGRGTTNSAAQMLGQFGTDTDWRTVAPRNTTCAIKLDNTLWCVGENDYGQLGRGTTSTGETTIVQVGTDTDWASVGGGEKFVCATKLDGTLWCWGYNRLDGQPRTSPVQVGTSTGWDQLDVYHRCATAQRGGAAYWSCGDALDLALVLSGAQTFDWMAMPVTPDPGTRIELGADSACVKQGGEWLCWGDNRTGAVGVDTLAVVGPTPLCE